MKSVRSVLAVIMLIGTLSVPQTVSANGEPLANQGSWQVVTNKNQKRISVVQFYNHKKELIYEERLEGVKLNLRDRHIIILLNDLLLKIVAICNDNKRNLDTNIVSWALKNQRKKTTI